MASSSTAFAWLVVAQLALAASLAACASLVGVQDGILESDGGPDGTTEGASADGGADATSEPPPAQESGADAGAAADSAATQDSATAEDSTVDAAADTSAADGPGPEASTDAAHDAPVDAPPDAPDSGGGCASQIVDTSSGVFVAPGGTDGTNCGTSSAAPCASVQAGLDSAFAQARKIVYVAAGAYTESIDLHAGITLQGGWNDSANAWTPICPDAGTASQAVTITAPATSNVTVTASSIGGKATVSTLTLASMPQASVQPGESIYGIIATGTTTTLALQDVVVHIAGGGAGNDGVAGSTPAAATGTCSAGSGATGTAGPQGTGSTGGAFQASGYATGNGTTATAGGPGGNGVAGGNAVCASCVTAQCSGSCVAKTTTNTCGQNGLSGCGGAGGGPGTGAEGGGSSIVLYIWDATVTCSDSTLAAGAGGKGGTGGAGGGGGAGSAGQKGMAAGSCTTTVGGNCITGCTTSGNVFLDGGAAGGDGGAGGAGGQGGGGAGGSSCVYFAGGAGTFTPSGINSFTAGASGAGGALGGANGFTGVACP